jgi:hypothetical protein
VIGTSKEKKIKCEYISDVEKLVRLVIRQLYDIGIELKYIVALVRKLLVDRFGNPDVEGWICDPTI